jgi:ribosomal protein S5
LHWACLTSLAGAQDATSQPAGYETALNQAKQASKALAEP